MVNLKDIAAEIGVSISTVSRALNGSSEISRSVTEDEAVLAAMREQTLEELARECAEKFMVFGVTPSQAAQLLLSLEKKKEE